MQSLNRRSPLTHTSVDLARVACALERYRLARAEYPSDLAALTPQFISSVPKDFINGKPLRYRRTTPSGFILYSVGLNRNDDGGTYPPESDTTIGESTPSADWVWRVP